MSHPPSDPGRTEIRFQPGRDLSAILERWRREKGFEGKEISRVVR